MSQTSRSKTSIKNVPKSYKINLDSNFHESKKKNSRFKSDPQRILTMIIVVKLEITRYFWFLTMTIAVKMCCAVMLNHEVIYFDSQNFLSKLIVHHLDVFLILVLAVKVGVLLKNGQIIFVLA